MVNKLADDGAEIMPATRARRIDVNDAIYKLGWTNFARILINGHRDDERLDSPKKRTDDIDLFARICFVKKGALSLYIYVILAESCNILYRRD